MGEPLNGLDVPYANEDMERVRLLANGKIKSAVEYLKSFFTGGLKVPEEYVLEKIDEAFPDLQNFNERG